MILSHDSEVLAQEDLLRKLMGDPSLMFLYNPRTQFWLICQDLRVCKKKSDPMVVRDEDLDGIVGIGVMTPIKCLLRCQFSDGARFTPNAHLAAKILQAQTRRKGDQDPRDYIYGAIERRDAAARQKIKDRAAEAGAHLHARLRGRKVFA